MTPVEVVVAFRRLDTNGFPVGIPPVVDVTLDPQPAFAIGGVVPDTRFRRHNFTARADSEWDVQFTLQLIPNDEISDEDTVYRVTIRWGSRKTTHTIKVPTADQAAAADPVLTAPYTLKELVDYYANLVEV